MLQTLPSRRADPAGAASPVNGAYKVDISRGERISRISSEWFSRPDDERYLSLTELHAAVRGRAERATARTVETKALRVEASRNDAERLALIVPGQDLPVAPTHWSYGQLCSLVGAPASYAEDGMTLDQLMAFTVNGDHERQEQVFERLCQSYDKQPYAIRRMLTEGAVRASDKRAQFIGVAAYEEAGGTVLNDLFQGDDGGWLQDVSLVDMMVAEKLNDAAVTIGAEGWKWVEVAPDFAYGHTYGLRQLRGETVPLTGEEEATLAALQQEVDDIETASAEAEELTDEQDQRMAELETAIEALTARPVLFETDDIARAGAFVSIAADGSLRIERGYVRPEDELPVEPAQGSDEDAANTVVPDDVEADAVHVSDEPAVEPEEDEGLRPIPDRLLTELTAHRTLALRHALGGRPEIAFLAALHALALGVFYTYRSDTCLELDLKIVQFGSQAPGLNDTPLALAFDERHQSWRSQLPKESGELWDALEAFDADSRDALFAHCVSLSVNAVHEAWNRRPKAFAHADRLAQAVDLDMAASWTPTAANFLGRVTKARSHFFDVRCPERLVYLLHRHAVPHERGQQREVNARWGPDRVQKRS